MPGTANIYKINYADYLCKNKPIADDAGMMLLHFLLKCEVKEVSLAGFDGFTANYNENYFEKDLYVNTEPEALLEKTSAIRNHMKELQKKININFLTPSLYNSANMNIEI